ncbi:MAG: hypothetical protein AAFQ91_24605 [Cyanobacteria bacterium J06621_15]
MPIPTNERRDDIIYFLLNKVKHSEEPQDISYYRKDFDGKIVEKDEVIEHLKYTMEKGYLKGEMVDGASASQEGDEAPFAVCKNVQITQEGLNVLRTDFFKV